MTKTHSITRLTAGIAATLLTVALAGPAFSQAQPAPAQPAPAKPAPAKPAPKPAAPAAAAPAPARPGAPDASAPPEQTFFNSPWEKICQEMVDEKDPKNKKKACQTTQVLGVNDQPIAQVVISGLEGEPNKGLNISVPLGFMIQPGLRIVFDDTPVAVPFVACVSVPNVGPLCSAQIVVGADFVAKMKSAKSVRLEAKNVAQREIRLPISNTDFAKVFDGAGMDVKVAAELQRKRIEEARAAQQQQEEQSKAALLKKGQELEQRAKGAQ